MDFKTWLRTKDILPKPDRVLLLIQSAWKAGVEEGALRAHADLPKDLMDELLQALVSSGMVHVRLRGGKRVYMSN